MHPLLQPAVEPRSIGKGAGGRDTDPEETQPGSFFPYCRGQNGLIESAHAIYLFSTVRLNSRGHTHYGPGVQLTEGLYGYRRW